VGRGEGDTPSGEWVWGGGSAPSAEIFFLRFWGSKWRIFVDSLIGAKFFFSFDQSSIEIHLEYRDCHGD